MAFYEPAQMMSFASHIGVAPQPIRWDIPLDEDVKEFAADYRSPNKPLVVISPCSSNRSRNFRNWSIENYAVAIKHLVDRGCRVVLTGGPSELEIKYGAALAANGIADDLVGKTSLKQLAALINALGLYATSNPDRTGPFASRELTVNRYPDAAIKYLGKPVEQLHWGQRVRHPNAMDLITVDDVVGKVDGFFDLDPSPDHAQ